MLIKMYFANSNIFNKINNEKTLTRLKIMSFSAEKHD